MDADRNAALTDVVIAAPAFGECIIRGVTPVDPVGRAKRVDAVRLVLASASPRRRELLASAGFHFDVDPADIDETRHAHESAATFVERLARAKADVVSRRHPGRAVLGADTIVVIEDEILGKPIDADDARRMLARLAGRTHEVWTGVAVVRDGETTSRADVATVRMTSVAAVVIDTYVATGEPLDKAGAYAIQGRAGAFMTLVSGARDTVVGLHIDAVRALLGPRGLIPPAAGRIL